MNGKVQNESELIATYLAPLAGEGGLGLADDAALIAADGQHDLVVTTDPIVRGVHFFADDAAADIAWKALAVNVSDVVAKGAAPFAYTLALGLPEAPTHAWMRDFACGLEAAQAAFGCRLIGGDTDRTPGALSIGVTAFGRVPAGRMVKRNTAQAGDHVFVSGTIGDAALGLRLRQDKSAFAARLTEEDARHLLGRYLRPQSRLALAPLLGAYASAALDVSDGLLQDAGKLAHGASAALEVRFAAVPLSQAAAKVAALGADYERCIVTGGDDYEVLFAVPRARVDDFRAEAARLPFGVCEIGTLREGTGVAAVHGDGTAMTLDAAGYDHFQRTYKT